MRRALVINADDLGLTVGVNNGIFDAHDRGILTSASLFANAPATPDAIKGVRSRPSLGVGCHLTLVDGQPTLPPQRVSSLLDDDGRFHGSWKPFLVRCLTRRVVLDEVEQELTAQVDRLRCEGITLTHLDAHKHVHAFPPIFAIVSRLAERFGIPVVRVPFERWSPVGGDAGERRIARRQALLNYAMLPWARRDYRTAAARGLKTPRFVGRIHTGVLSPAALLGILRSLGPGTTELMVHPGYVDAALSQTRTRLLTSRADEVRLLCDPSTLRFVDDARIELVRHDFIFSIDRNLRHAS